MRLRVVKRTHPKSKNKNAWLGHAHLFFKSVVIAVAAGTL